MEVKNIIKGKSAKPIDPVESLVRHWFMIIVFSMIGFMISIPLIIILSTPYYDATGKLRIAPVIPAFIAQTEDFSITAYYHDYVRTQVNRIQNQEILEQAIKRLPEEIKDEFIPDETSLSFAATVLGRRLAVSQVPDTHLIQIYLDGDSPSGLAEIVNSIMEVYLDNLQQEEDGKDNKRLQYLQDEKDRLEIEIAQQSEILEKVAVKAATSTFSEEFNIHTRQLQDLQEAYTRAYSTRVLKENAYKQAAWEADALSKVSLQPLIDEMVEKDESLWDTSFWTYTKLQEIRASLDGLTGDNPDRKYIDERMNGMQLYMRELRNDVRKRADDIINRKRDVEIAEKLILSESEYIAAKNVEEKLRAERDVVQAKASETSALMLKGMQIEVKLTHIRGLLDRMNDRIHELRLESRAPGRVSMESPARKPDRPAGSNTKKLIVVFLLLVIGSITCAVIVYDYMDKRVRSVKDVMNALGFSPTWPISDYRVSGKKNIPFSRVTLDDPTHIVAIAIRSLAVRLDKERTVHNAKLAVFSGVDPESGTTGIWLNTAHAMTRLCEKVLIIDGNILGPGLLDDYTAAEKGLVDLLQGKADLQQCIVHDNERGLDVIQTGHVPSKEELLQLDNIKLLHHLDALRNIYDFILIDTASVLTSDFTEYLIVKADIGVIVIQGDRSYYENLYRTAEIMSKFEISAVAAVLNWGAPRHISKVEAAINGFLLSVKERVFRKKEGPDWKI